MTMCRYRLSKVARVLGAEIEIKRSEKESELAISATEIRRWKKRTESVQRTPAFSRPAFDGSFRVCFSNLKQGTVWPMHVRVERWGNSLAVRIPKSLAENTEVKEGMVVDLTIRRGKIMAIMVQKGKPSLKQLLDKVNTKNRHAEIDFAASIGRES